MRSLIFCSILMFMSAAHAELTASQMKSAHARIEKGNLIEVQLDCPSGFIPEQVMTKEQFSTLEQSFTAYEACFQNILDHTYRPNIVSLLKIEYPLASASQHDELLQAVQRAVAPIRASKKEAFLQVRAKAQLVARPFVLKQQLIEAFSQECNEPPMWETLRSVAQAKQWISSVRAYHECLGELTGQVNRQNAHEFVAKNFGNEPESVRARLVYEFPTTQKEISERLMRWDRELSYKFSQANNYINSNGKTMNGPGED